MTSANERQIGGDHYGGGEYQHWDFVEDVPLRYLPGTATKYIARWRRKGGRQDLEKAIHYLDKCIERSIPAPKWVDAIGAFADDSPLEKFLDTGDYTYHERKAITAVVMGDYSRAKAIVEGHLLPAASVAEAHAGA